MTADYRTWSARIRQLDRALADLVPVARTIAVEPPTGEDWFELLRLKLLPQLGLPPLLVVGIVGGTNIGKSLLFNHLAGEIASGVSPLAAGTKHPVCLVPPGLEDPAILRRKTRSRRARKTCSSGAWGETSRRACCSWTPPTSTPTPP
jgi:50S ribosome-binding GTPase